MIVLGLTGSIGMGKSTAAGMLRAMNVPVHDSDEAVHRLLGPDGAAVASVLERFPAVGDRQGGIDRKALGKIVFADAEERRWLESLLHPLVIESQARFINAERAKGTSLVTLDIPLLYETGGEQRVDYVLVVSASPSVQRRRMEKRGMSMESFAARLALQTPDAEKRRRADFVVQTGWGMTYTKIRLRLVVWRLHRMAKRHRDGRA